MKTRDQKDCHASGEVASDKDALSPANLDELWAEAQLYIGTADSESLEDALSGDDIPASQSYLHWLAHSIREKLDELWAAAQLYMDVADSESFEDALSGDDIPASQSYLHWLAHSIRERQPLPEDLREYALSALARFSLGRVTLGRAFGLERGKRGNPPTRAGAKQAIVGLIEYLHDQHGYSLGESSDKPSAFEIAKLLIARKWKLDLKPNTLRDQYWAKRRGKSVKP